MASFTGDMLAASVNPQAIYVYVGFEGGGKMMFDFTDCDLDKLATGMAVASSFSRKFRTFSGSRTVKNPVKYYFVIKNTKIILKGRWNQS